MYCVLRVEGSSGSGSGSGSGRGSGSGSGSGFRLMAMRLIGCWPEAVGEISARERRKCLSGWQGEGETLIVTP